jgi:hypothetical protein
VQYSRRAIQTTAARASSGLSGPARWRQARIARSVSRNRFSSRKRSHLPFRSNVFGFCCLAAPAAALMSASVGAGRVVLTPRALVASAWVSPRFRTCRLTAVLGPLRCAQHGAGFSFQTVFGRAVNNNLLIRCDG